MEDERKDNDNGMDEGIDQDQPHGRDETERQAGRVVGVDRRGQPSFIIGSQICTAFSMWQHLNVHKRDVYRKQFHEGRYLLHEHPVAASSWQEACMQSFMREEGVGEVNMDKCQFGQRSIDGGPVKKPAKRLS